MEMRDGEDEDVSSDWSAEGRRGGVEGGGEGKCAGGGIIEFLRITCSVLRNYC